MGASTRNLAFYTTTVESGNSAAEMVKLLSIKGARHVSQEFDGQGYVTGLSFGVLVGDREVFFKVPVDHEACYKAMNKRAQVFRIPKSLLTREQARRVAWRIALHWIEAQMAVLDI